MGTLLASTRRSLRIGRLHADLAVRNIRPPAPDGVPCIGAKVAALQTAVRDLMDEHPEDLSPEARTILRELAPLSFRCRDLWRAQ